MDMFDSRNIDKISYLLFRFFYNKNRTKKYTHSLCWTLLFENVVFDLTL